MKLPFTGCVYYEMRLIWARVETFTVNDFARVVPKPTGTAAHESREAILTAHAKWLAGV
jgi:hypothetical protein